MLAVDPCQESGEVGIVKSIRGKQDGPVAYSELMWRNESCFRIVSYFVESSSANLALIPLQTLSHASQV